MLRHSRKKELVDDLDLARLVKSDGGHHVGQRLLVGRSGGNHFGNLFRKMFWMSGEKSMGLELKKVDKNKGGTKMYLPAAWFVDKSTAFFFEAQYLLGRIPYLRKKKKKKRTAHINLCASIHVISYA